MRDRRQVGDSRLISRIQNLRKDPPFVIFQTILDKATLNTLQVRRFFFLHYDGIPSVSKLRGPGTVREGTSGDLDEMSRFENKKHIFSKRFAAKDHCIVAVVNGRIVGYEWLTDKPYHLEERFLYRINIPSDSVYAYDAYISPEYRMCGFWLKFKSSMAEVMQELRRRSIVTMVDYENSLSMNTHLRFGFIPLKDIFVIRVLGRNFFRESSRLYRRRLLAHE